MSVTSLSLSPSDDLAPFVCLCLFYCHDEFYFSPQELVYSRWSIAVFHSTEGTVCINLSTCLNLTSMTFKLTWALL